MKKDWSILSFLHLFKDVYCKLKKCQVSAHVLGKSGTKAQVLKFQHCDCLRKGWKGMLKACLGASSNTTLGRVGVLSWMCTAAKLRAIIWCSVSLMPQYQNIWAKNQQVDDFLIIVTQTSSVRLEFGFLLGQVSISLEDAMKASQMWNYDYCMIIFRRMSLCCQDTWTSLPGRVVLKYREREYLEPRVFFGISWW